MRISDWSSDVCSSDLQFASGRPRPAPARRSERRQAFPWGVCLYLVGRELERHGRERDVEVGVVIEPGDTVPDGLHRETVAARALVALVVEQRRFADDGTLEHLVGLGIGARRTIQERGAAAFVDAAELAAELVRLLPRQ